MSLSHLLSRNPRSSGLLVVVALGLVLVLGAFLNTRADDKKPTMKDAPATTGTPAEQARKAEQLKKLTPEQFHVTQESGTEPAFHNAYWNNHKPGIYVDVVTGEPLFSSTDKFESGTGWPSFTKPIQKEAVVEKTDRAYGMARTEVRSRQGDCHLGHVFDDGPAPTGMRYCMNSAALRFIPADKLQEAGYGQFAALFEPAHQATAQADAKK